MEFKIDGLTVKIEPAEKNLDLKRSKVRGLVHWRCPCGVQTLRIRKEDLQRLPQDTGNKPVRQQWDLTTQSLKLTMKWNKINNDSKTFIEYFRKVFNFKNEHRMIIGALRFSGGTTFLRLKCSTCGRHFDFSIRIFNPVEPVSELTAFEAFHRFNLQNTGELKSLLAKWLHENKTFETTEDFLTHIEHLDSDQRKAQKVVGKIVEIIDSVNLKSEHLEEWLKDLRRRLQFLEDFKSDSQKELEKHLRIIMDSCKPPMYDVVIPAETFP